MTDDDRAVRQRLAELEAEVKAETAAATARKQAARAKQLAQAQSEASASPEIGRSSSRSGKSIESKRSAARRAAPPTPGDDFAAALELAERAGGVKRELQKRPGKGEKSWIGSGLASLALGPLGWLYAGAWREAIPASIAWVILVSIASKLLPTLLTIPVLLVALPASAIAGVTYALQHNRQGGRSRLFGKAADAKQLKGDL